MNRLFGTTPTEQKFEEELEVFRTEVEQAKQFFYAQLAINAETGEDERIFEFMNRTPLLWNTIQYALQKGAFLALGRVFDTDSDVHGLARLMRLAHGNRDMFSRAALSARKPELPGYADTAHEPTDQQFRDIKREIARWRAIFDSLYKPLRNRFYAHRERMVRVDEQFEGTRIDQVEEMLAFLGSLYDALWQCFVNGAELKLSPQPHSVQAMREQASRSGSTGGTVQEQTVREAREMLKYAARSDS